MLTLNAYNLRVVGNVLHYWPYVGIVGGPVGFKEFSFAEAFHPSWSCSGFWIAYECLALPSVLLVSVWDLAVSLSAYSKFFSWNLEGWEERVGLTCFSFFFLQTSQRMQLSWLQVCLFCWQVIMQYCSDPAAIRMHCETTGVWLKVVFPNAWSSDCWRKKSSWVIKAECWGNFCSFKQSCLWLKLSTFCRAFLGKMLFVHFWWWGVGTEAFSLFQMQP